ncbi:MAG: hypothetical protein Q9219_000086 [cf. Caloplaca sp. 3 TL-2023]
MYQTVGHNLVPLYAEMLALPLYRQQILGSAVNQEKDYHSPTNSRLQRGVSDTMIAEDETETMLVLLHRIKKDHPEANAVCSGAILSNYQRTRIESVALRLQLVPLAYLWQYPDLPSPEPRTDGLLEDMAAIGLDARLIKVASGGLDESLLWENVCGRATRKRITKAMERFGGSVLGEGGEFETLVLSGPLPFFEGAIQIEEGQRRVIRGGGGEAWIAFTGGTVEKKGKERCEIENWLEKLRMPDLLDKMFEGLLETPDQEDHRTQAVDVSIPATPRSPGNVRQHIQSYVYTGKWTSKISNVSCSGNDTEEQIEKIKDSLLSLLEATVKRSVHDIISTTILLRSMDDFPVVNQSYAELFSSRPNPPARVTVACGDSLPRGVNVMISVIVSLQTDIECHRLHVQSRSYWAPANIGPYSQATTLRLDNEGVGALVYIAGQIPLIPESMDVVTRASLPENIAGIPGLTEFRLQSALSLQHLWRIGKTMKVGWWIGAVAFLVAESHDQGPKALTSASIWAAAHAREYYTRSESLETLADNTDFDVWDQERNGNRNFMPGPEAQSLLDFSCLSVVHADDSERQIEHDCIPPFFAVEVAQLPRQSEIEWQALGLSQAPLKVVKTISQQAISITIFSMASDNITFGFVEIKLVNEEINIDRLVEQSLLLLQVRCNIANAADGHKTIYTAYDVDCDKFKAELIPGRSVWNARGEQLAAAMVVYHEPNHGLEETNPC